MTGISCVGSNNFETEHFLSESNPAYKGIVEQLNRDNNLWRAICESFGIDPTDQYIYKATSSTTLVQAQRAIQAGRANGLHGWYTSGDGEEYPTTADIEAYIEIFNPAVSSLSAVKNMQSNAKKDSLRARIGGHLISKRFVDDTFNASVPKLKGKTYENPYFDFWAWSCRNLEWAGPTAQTSTHHISHHVLIILMLSFGCACPSYEALALISKISQGRTIIDMGSGNGYWTWMLRRHTSNQVVPVDSLQSSWRAVWIEDTLVEDGIEILRKRNLQEESSKDTLLLVYPIVGLDFTSRILSEFKGQHICVVGNQNNSGFTSFKDQLVSQWMSANRTDFMLVAQLPLPSFAGKDDALFVFSRIGA